MKKLKKYNVIVMLSSFGQIQVEAEDKAAAEKAAYEADRNGQIDYGEQEIDHVEVQIMYPRRKI